MPRLWSETIAAHRDAVRDAALDATAALVARHGVTGVTMSQIAKDAGIGRATLYKYFPDVESMLRAWHERQIDEHLKHLHRVRDETRGSARRLEAVLTAYAEAIAGKGGHDDGLAVMMHSGEHVAAAHRHLREFVQELMADAVAAGAVREDVPADELTRYCLHALGAARGLHDPVAIGRLVRTTLAGLRPDTPARG
ncbi:TetR/AcrR family transcriptional regulator [Actinomadura formosensis]|uniref:TetR/AcrR family transcriptional regulator n=1 Tax=Actinomadura formosensis TaxID=60706 RepID=UPI000833F67F|nr:TetR/AcrR family transcriptional regulator [Actinomadura formosensis]